MPSPIPSRRFPTAALARASLLALTIAGVGFVLWQSPARSAEKTLLVPAPAVDEPASSSSLETAVFAGGCFWGVQGVYQRVKGVSRAVSGYAGGDAATAHYEIVSSGQTGHAESVQVTYDPKQVSYGQLLQIYFSVVADPTLKNRQGPDHGTQYRSAIFAKDAMQKDVAAKYIAQLDKAGIFDKPIVTTIEPLQAFYPAEGYHQDFLVQNPTYPYIAINDIPKVEALQKLFPQRYREAPVLVSSSVTAR